MGRDLLDGDRGGVDDRNAVPAQQRLGLVDFPLALFERRVAARCAALAADSLQLQGLDGESHQLLPVGGDGIRKRLPFQVLVHQRIVGGLQPVVQGQVEAGGVLPLRETPTRMTSASS